MLIVGRFNEVDLITALECRINKLVEVFNLSEDRFFRSKLQSACTIETYRRFIKESRMTINKYNKLVKRVEELEITLSSKN